MKRIIQPLLRAYDYQDTFPPAWRGRIGLDTWNKSHRENFILFGLLTITAVQGSIQWRKRRVWGYEFVPEVGSSLSRLWEGKRYFQ